MKKNIHFLGINGSGIVGVACLAKENNFNVTGCDLNKKSNYSDQLEALNIDVQIGQSSEHLKNIDCLVVSAAVFFKDRYKHIDEITDAIKNNINVIRWQEFLDKYLVNDKELICICGTHGKTTTTTILSNLLEQCDADPTAIIGGINTNWGKNYRNGKGKYFVCEADEYGKNFTYYHPKYIIINNIEMEHPEFFTDLENYKSNFIDFINNIKNDGIIIFNGDDENILDILDRRKDFLKNKNIKLICYNITNKNFKSNFIKSFYIDIFNDESFFINNNKFVLNKLHGQHNIRNSIISVLFMNELGFNYEEIKNSLSNCAAPKRRMEKILENETFVVYDDYAHHHTQLYYNLKTLKNSITQDEKIIAILEPHLVSRYKDNYTKFNNYLEIADFSIITKFFKSREEDLNDLNMQQYLKNTNINYIETFDDIIKKISIIIDTNTFKKIHIVVMGAGLSYKLSEKIVNFLKK